MNKRVAVGLYIAAWAGLSASVFFGLVRAGVPIWGSFVLAYLLFFILNGSIAYWYRARQVRLEGKHPPSYFMYLFFPAGFPISVRVPRLIRVVLGVVVSLGGASFVFIGIALAANLGSRNVPHPIGAVAILLILALLGTGFLYVGVRLFVVKNDEALFKRFRFGRTPHDKAA